MDSSITTIIWIVAFVLVTITVTGFSGRIGWSTPVCLVIVGGIVSFIPGIPPIRIEPDLILYALLPPLLFATAIRSSIADIRARGDSIFVLSVVLVLLTVVSVGFFTWWVVPAITLATGFAFAAVVAPTDAVAVTAVAGRGNLPRRLLTVVESESLFNDAAALVALSAAISAIVGVIDPPVIALEFVLAVVVGVGFGFAVGYGTSFIRKRLTSPVIDTALSLATPFLAFIPAQLLHGSGVLAVVIAGLIISYHAPVVQSAEARIASSINWRTIRFLLENSVFLFIGLNLKGILDGTAESKVGLWATIGICVATLLFLVVSRTLWILLATLVFRRGPRQLRARGWSWKIALGVGFSGIRGVVTLAAVFLLPPETPQRPFLQLLAFVVVVGTLIQGLALPPFIRMLKLPQPNSDQEHMEAHQLLVEVRAAGAKALDEQTRGLPDSPLVDKLRADAELFTRAMEGAIPQGNDPKTVSMARLRLGMIEAERAAVLKARGEGRFQDKAIRDVLASIDAEEVAVRVLGQK